MVIAPSIVKIGLDLFEPLLMARTVERVVDLHLKRKIIAVERTSALSTLHSQRAEHFASKTLCLCPKDPMPPTQLFTQCVNFLKRQIEPTHVK